MCIYIAPDQPGIHSEVKKKEEKKEVVRMEGRKGGGGRKRGRRDHRVENEGKYTAKAHTGMLG